jgi:WD40 repeat protein
VVDGSAPLAFSSDGKVLVTGERDWRVAVGKVWDTGTGRLLAELRDRSPGVWPLALSPDGKLLAATAHEGDALWEIPNGRRWPLAAKGGGSRAPAFSRDAMLVFPNGLPRGHYAYDMNVDFQCYDVSSTPPRQLDLGTAPFIASPDARRYVQMLGRTQSEPRCTLVIRDLPSLRASGRLDMTDLIQADFSPDGRWLLLSTARNVKPTQWTGIFRWLKDRIPALFPPDRGWQSIHEIRLLDPATARLRATIRPPDPIWQDPHWMFSPDGKMLAVWYTNGTSTDPDIFDRPVTIELWDVLPRKPIGLMLGVPITLTFLAILLGRRADTRKRFAPRRQEECEARE